MLAPAALNGLKRVARHAMKDIATIVNFTTASDGAGGTTTVEQRIENVPCYRFPLVTGAGSLVIAGQMVQGLRWEFGFPLGTDVREDSRIEIDGASYEVEALVAPATTDAVTRVYAVKR